MPSFPRTQSAIHQINQGIEDHDLQGVSIGSWFLPVSIVDDLVDCVCAQIEQIVGHFRSQIASIHDTYNSPTSSGSLVRDNSAFLVSWTGRQVNKVLIPLAGIQSFSNQQIDFGDPLIDTVIGIDAAAFVLFCFFFARVGRIELLVEFLQKNGVKKLLPELAVGYIRGCVINYLYMYRLLDEGQRRDPRLTLGVFRICQNIQTAARSIGF